MRFVRLYNVTRDDVLCARCGVADNIVTRVRGLLGRTHLPDDEGLLIAPCPSIHMFRMKFALDVIFLSRDHTVVDWIENIAPGKLYVAKTPDAAALSAVRPPLPALEERPAKYFAPHLAIELPVGSIARSGVQIGDKIERRNLEN